MCTQLFFHSEKCLSSLLKSLSYMDKWMDDDMYYFVVLHYVCCFDDDIHVLLQSDGPYV